VLSNLQAAVTPATAQEVSHPLVVDLQIGALHLGGRGGEGGVGMNGWRFRCQAIRGDSLEGVHVTQIGRAEGKGGRSQEVESPIHSWLYVRVCVCVLGRRALSPPTFVVTVGSSMDDARLNNSVQMRGIRPGFRSVPIMVNLGGASIRYEHGLNQVRERVW